MIDGKRTNQLLSTISKRLSGRSDCKNVNYIVKINDKGVSMTPRIEVFPNRYRRCERDKIDIVSWVHSCMPEIMLSDLVFGTYVYQSSIDNKKRRWIKIEGGQI